MTGFSLISFSPNFSVFHCTVYWNELKFSEEPVSVHLDVGRPSPGRKCEACTVVVRASVPSGPSSVEGIAKAIISLMTTDRLFALSLTVQLGASSSSKSL